MSTTVTSHPLQLESIRCGANMIVIHMVSHFPKNKSYVGMEKQSVAIQLYCTRKIGIGSIFWANLGPWMTWALVLARNQCRKISDRGYKKWNLLSHEDFKQFNGNVMTNTARGWDTILCFKYEHVCLWMLLEILCLHLKVQNSSNRTCKRRRLTA